MIFEGEYSGRLGCRVHQQFLLFTALPLSGSSQLGVFCDYAVLNPCATMKD